MHRMRATRPQPFSSSISNNFLTTIFSLSLFFYNNVSILYLFFLPSPPPPLRSFVSRGDERRFTPFPSNNYSGIRHFCRRIKRFEDDYRPMIDRSTRENRARTFNWMERSWDRFLHARYASRKWRSREKEREPGISG